MAHIIATNGATLTCLHEMLVLNKCSAAQLMTLEPGPQRGTSFPSSGCKFLAAQLDLIAYSQRVPNSKFNFLYPMCSCTGFLWIFVSVTLLLILSCHCTFTIHCKHSKCTRSVRSIAPQLLNRRISSLLKITRLYIHNVDGGKTQVAITGLYADPRKPSFGFSMPRSLFFIEEHKTHFQKWHISKHAWYWSSNFGTNRKHVCDFLLVRHSNLGPILSRFRDIAGFLLRNWPPPPIPPQFWTRSPMFGSARAKTLAN